MTAQDPIIVGDTIEKTKGDYRFKGKVVSVFSKASGAVRLVAENSDGLLFIFNPQHIQRETQ